MEQAYFVGGPLLRSLLALFIPFTAIADIDGSVRAAGQRRGRGRRGEGNLIFSSSAFRVLSARLDFFSNPELTSYTIHMIKVRKYNTEREKEGVLKRTLF